MAEPAASPSPDARRWFAKAKSSSALDRMPLLADIMADVARAWTASFAELSGAAGEVSARAFAPSTIAAVAIRRQDVVLALIQAPEWQTVVGVLFDRAFLGMVVDAVFGGDGLDEGSAEPGPPTAIEIRMADVLARQAAAALETGFKIALPATFIVSDVQTKAEWALLGKPQVDVLIASCGLSALGRTAEVDIILPTAALEPLADRSVDGQAAPASPPDARWSRTFEAEVGRAEVTLSACIDVPALTLGALARFAPGNTIALPAGATTNVHLRCESKTLFRCELGQAAGFYTVRIDGEAGPNLASLRQLAPLQAGPTDQQ